MLFPSLEEFVPVRYGAVAKWLRQRIANPLYPGSSPGGASYYMILDQKTDQTTVPVGFFC